MGKHIKICSSQNVFQWNMRGITAIAIEWGLGHRSAFTGKNDHVHICKTDLKSVKKLFF